MTKESLAQLDVKVKALSASYEKLKESKSHDVVSPEMDYMGYMNDCMNYMNQQLNQMYNTFADYVSTHRAGHFPALKSVEQMQRVVDKLGLGAEYDVAKRMIYASVTKDNGQSFEVSVTKPK